jgi:hypothetical protein
VPRCGAAATGTAAIRPRVGCGGRRTATCVCISDLSLSAAHSCGRQTQVRRLIVITISSVRTGGVPPDHVPQRGAIKIGVGHVGICPSAPQLKLFFGRLLSGFCRWSWSRRRLAAVIPSVDEGPDLDHEVSDGGNARRWMAWRSMMPNQTSTRFRHDPRSG